MATVSVTFDNLGEAADLERGIWPEDQPLGEHFTVREGLPQLLALLAGADLRATFFVEGLNGELYPEALAGLRAAGHEVAAHGWRHEPWREVEDERDRLARTRDALGGPVGFRPPGGVLNPASPALLTELGYRYASPAGDAAGRLDGFPVLPFRWQLIDAYHFVPHFGEMRKRHGDPEEPMEPAALRERVVGALDAHAATDDHLALIFHPFLLADGPEAVSVLAELLAHVGRLHAEGTIRCLRMDEAAAAMPDDAAPPRLDLTGW